MSYHKPYQRILAAALSIVMVLGMCPVSAAAKELPDGISGRIIAFEELLEETANQTVPFGTALESLDLPGALTAEVGIDTVHVSIATESEAEEPEEETETEQSIPVTWVSDPDYDGTEAGVYTFAPDLELPEGLTLEDDVSAPVIAVTVGEESSLTEPVATAGEAEPALKEPAAAAGGEVTAFAALSEEVRWQSVEYGTALEDLNLPRMLFGSVEGAEAEVPVTWESEPEYDGASKGLYLFTAVPEEGFTADGEPVVIAVVVRGAEHGSRTLLRGGGAMGSDPFFIGSAAQLAAIAEIVNAGNLETLFLGVTSGTVYLQLENDIDLSGYTSGGGWTPIGTDGNRFKGSLDGGGNQITGLTINRPGATFQGLFGHLANSGIVQNLGVTDVSIICGNEIYGGTGGVAGYASGTIKNCYVTGSISGGTKTGGVVGQIKNTGVVEDCYSAADVVGTGYVGGVAGGSDGTVHSCYATGSVTGTAFAGGVMGFGTVKNCAALNPSVSIGVNPTVGRVAGNSSVDSGNIAFAGMTVNGTAVSGGTANNNNGENKTAAELQAATGFPAVLTADPWTYAPGKLPGLNGQTVEMSAHLLGSPPFEGGGISGDPYQITTAAQLARLAMLVNEGTAPYPTACYRLENDLDLSGYASGEGWTPIGTTTNANAFNGRFDGNCHRISGLFINRPDSYDQGLFGFVEDGFVQKLGMVDVNITGKDRIGGVAGWLQGSCTVQNCYVTGKVTGQNNVGGVAGNTSGSSPVPTAVLQNCYVTASISGADNVGGLAGVVLFGTIQNCAALNASVNGSPSLTGRVTGYSGNSVLSNNFAFVGTPVNGAAVTGTVSNNNGQSVTAGAIKENPAMGILFTSDEGWMLVNGKLPGFGAAVELPAYLLGGTPFEGAGTSASDPYKITSSAQLAMMAMLVNAGPVLYSSAYYRLENDLDLSGYASGGGWTPIGPYNTGFKGQFNGGGHKITGLFINRPGTSFQGLFGYVSSGGLVEGLGVTGVNITGQSYVGGVAGAVIGIGSTVQNCYSDGNVSGANDIGGVAGVIGDGTVQNCYSAAVIGGTARIGGVAGGGNGTVQNCAALNPVISGSTAGRLAGDWTDGILSGNIAFSGMKVNGTTVPGGSATDRNGAPITAADIAADGTLGSRFVNNGNPWTTENGKLPGFGGAVEMPLYLIKFSTTPLTVSLSGNDISGSGASYSIPFSSSDRIITVNVTGWEDWTNPEVTVTVKDPDNNAITVTPQDTLNGSASFTLPAAVYGAFTISAAARSNPGNKTTVTLMAEDNIIRVATLNMIVPAAGATPQTAAQAEIATSNPYYTVSSVTWNEALTAASKFKAGQTYTADVILTSKNERLFQPAAFTPSVVGAAEVGTTNTSGTGTGNTVSFTVTFPATAAKAVTGVSVKTSPAKLTYTAGEALDLSGLAVTLTYNDGSEEEVLPADFGGKGITASPAGGEALSIAAHNGQPVTLTCNLKTAVTVDLTVGAVIAASAGAGGTISPSGSVTVSPGGSQTFTITPDSARLIASVTVDGVSLGAVSSYTFSNVTASHTISAAFTAEQFSLSPGSICYFDLSEQGIPGTVNADLPDTSLKWVPFTYGGTVRAYSLDTGSGGDASASGSAALSDRSLFVSDYNVTHTVSWDSLNNEGLIFGRNCGLGGIEYKLRSLSEGSKGNEQTGADARGIPGTNEWDQILNKDGGFIKNWDNSASWGQDTSSDASSYRAVRGVDSARTWTLTSSSYDYWTSSFRPALEVLNPGTLGINGLKTVIYDMDGKGTLGSGSLTSAAVVYTGTLTLPEIIPENGFVCTGSGTGTLGWYDGTTFYAPGAAPALATGTTLRLGYEAPAGTAPAITGPSSMTLTEGYGAASTDAYTLEGTEPIVVEKTAGDEKITWNSSTRKLDIAPGLPAGTYPVTLSAGNGVSPEGTLNFTLTVGPGPAEVISVTVKIAPVRTAYTAGDLLDLTGLEVTLHKSDSSVEDIALEAFGAKGITVTPAEGTILAAGNTRVTVRHRASGKSADQTITVRPAAVPGTVDSSDGGSGDDSGGSPTGAASLDKSIADAIARAQAEAKAQGIAVSGVSAAVNVPAAQGAQSLTLTLSQEAIQSLVNAGGMSFKINSSLVSLRFDQKALAEIQRQAEGDVTISASPVRTLPGGAGELIGGRPAYEITAGYVRDGKTLAVTGLNGGTATIFIPYTPGENEALGCLCGVYVDTDGSGVPILGSAYDRNSGNLMIPTGHLSVYGVGYIAPAAKFTDIEAHWAREAIDYAVGSGFLSGISDTAFAPDGAVTWEMVTAALGRLAGAYGNDLLPYADGQQFEPGRAVTREELAVILLDYARASGHKLPAAREAAAYADDSDVGTACREAVAAMQRAGVMMGRSGNKFQPKANTTRAEFSFMLYRYIKLTLDPATAQGWALNDDGQWFYYKDGRALTGTQTIHGVKYFFDFDGKLRGETDT